MLTPKARLRSSSGQDEADRLMATIKVGGSTDSDETEDTVMPEMSWPCPTVMTLTPPTSCRIAPRKSAGEMSWSGLSEKFGTTMVMAGSPLRLVLAGTQKLTQDRALQRRKIGRAAPARTPDGDIDVVRDP